MSLAGKNSLSIRRKDVKEQKSVAIGIKKTVFAHKASAGDAGIDVNSLILPTEMSSLGFSQPNTADILAANMWFYKNNVRIVSSHKGVLMGDLSYTIRSTSYIRFEGWTAEEGEIFVVEIDQNAKTQLTAVDANPISATGTLAAGNTDFNVGTPFKVNEYPTAQVGAVTVFVDGVQQFRNSTNAASPADGNYYEVDAGDGTGVLIRFNTTSLSDRDIYVKSNGFAEKPNASQLAEVENVQGQIDAMVPTLAALAGVAETEFQAAPNNVDLKQFGDRVLQNEVDIAGKEDAFTIPYQIKTLSASVSTNTTLGDLTFNNLEIGKRYAITLTMRYVHTNTSINEKSFNMEILNGATSVGAIYQQFASLAKVNHHSERTFHFTATDTILTFVSSGALNLQANGDGTINNTCAKLQEAPHHVTTTQWT